MKVAIGAALGAALGYFGQCSSGTCPLTSTWWRGALYGSAMGLVFALVATPSSGQKSVSANMMPVAGESQFNTEVLHRVYQNLMVDLRATNAKLRDRAARVVATLTGLSREQSFDLLDRAGGEAKTAVVMHHRHLDRPAAEAALAAADGRLDRVLDA